MRALLLIAGQSKRFWPLQEKPLFSLCGQTLIEHQLARLRAAGIQNITLVGSAANLHIVHTRFPDLPTLEQEDLSLGMLGAMLSALPACKDESVLVVSGNDVVDPSAYTALLQAAHCKDVDGAILARRVNAYFPGGYLTLDGNRVTDIKEKPGAGNEPSDLVNIVAHVHKNPATLLTALRQIDPAGDDGYEKGLCSLLLTQKYVAVAHEGMWQAVKYPWHLLDLLPHFLSEITEPCIHSSVSLHASAIVHGAVVLEEGVRVMPHATIVGPCFVGKNSIIANNALVRGSSIGRHCVVGYSSEVKASVLGDHVWMHMSYIGDSTIGNNVSFGGGSVVGNFRLDEQEIHSVVQGKSIPTGRQKFGTAIGDNCRLGIHTSINPGIKIGGGSFIASGVLLEEDIPEHSFVRMRDGKLCQTTNRVTPPQAENRHVFRQNIQQ